MKKYRFRAKIEAGGGGGAYVLFPFDVGREFGTKGKVPVKAAFNGFPYAGSLIKYGHTLHLLPVLKAIRQQIGADAGDTVEVELWKDEAPRTVEAPAAFQQAMKRAGVRDIFDGLSPTHRREYCRLITEAKREETRVRRLERAIEMLKQRVKTPDAAPARKLS